MRTSLPLVRGGSKGRVCVQKKFYLYVSARRSRLNIIYALTYGRLGGFSPAEDRRCAAQQQKCGANGDIIYGIVGEVAEKQQRRARPE